MPASADPGINQYRCNACGRYFDAREELNAHEVECRAAKEATREGREELAREDSKPHLLKDQESKEHPFEHGIRD